MEKTLAIIGGGAAGLCAAKHMLSSSQGLKLIPVIFEQKDCVGGTWVYEDVEESTSGEVFSSMYKSLRTNLPKEIMNFGDVLYPEHLPSFIHHTDVRAYLERYTQNYALEDVIRYNKKVLEVRAMKTSCADKGATRWRVLYEDVGSKKARAEEFDGIIVCNGHYTTPSYPNIPGLEHFRNRYMHSHYYRTADRHTGKNALVLGAGPSAVDIALELCQSFETVFISHRSKQRFQTKLLSNCIEMPDIHSVEEDGGFLFENGRKLYFDWFIPCTGYEFDFDFLDYNELGLRVEYEKKVVRDLYKHMFLINNPTLCFIGLPLTVAPFPLINQQCAFAINVYSGLKQLPSAESMLRDTKMEFEETLSRGEPERYFHKMKLDQFDYLDEIGRLAGVSVVPPYVKKMYGVVMEERRKNLLNYRQLNFKTVNDNEFGILE